MVLYSLLFSEFGLVTSCKIMCDSEWQSRGFGFVAFATPEDATRAMNALNGKVIGQKPLHVAVAQRKEERKEVLQVR
ncbi:Polyadenylate-binding protein 5 [Ranunculus cassubicifolius]